jgi:hypothetical protein
LFALSGNSCNEFGVGGCGRHWVGMELNPTQLSALGGSNGNEFEGG